MHYRNQRPISLRNNKDLLASHALEHFGLRPHVLVYGWRRMLIQKRKTRMRCKHLSAYILFLIRAWLVAYASSAKYLIVRTI